MSKKNFFYKVLLIFVLLETNSFAYLDPGSSSIIVQILVAILATVTFYFRATLNFFKNIFIKIRNLFKKKND